MDDAVKPIAASGSPAVHSLDHFALSVPDLKVAKTFYTDFGLDVRETEAGLELYTFGHPHRWAVIREGARKHLDYLTFGVFADDLPRFRTRLDQLGIPQVAPQPNSDEGDSIWFQNHDGLPIQLRIAEKSSPAAKTSFRVESCGPGETSAIPRSRAPRVYPRHLSHFLVFSSDVLRDIEYYRNVLGLKLSDHSGGLVAFMHGPYGSDHHLLALVTSAGPGMHHCSWDVGSVQEVGLGGAHMASKGYKKGWGLGRHVLGANYFYYVQDPWGSWAEYSADIDFIPEGHQWSAADHPPEDSLFLWGPDVPEDFMANLELD